MTSFQQTAVSEMMASTTDRETLKASRTRRAGNFIGVSRGRHRLKMDNRKSEGGQLETQVVLREMFL